MKTWNLIPSLWDT